MPRKTLHRSDEDRILSGVLGGLGEYFKVDPNILRILAVVLLIVLPIPMVVLYLAAAFLIPRKGKRPVAANLDLSEHKQLIIGFVLFILGSFFTPYFAGTLFSLAAPYGFFIFLNGIIGAILIIVGAVLMIPPLRKI
ncbi:MAG: PspC domain-containing protein [Thaumarchaeota archaeon]|nr:PspC domain-containing protein [Nitrososphaerota archaeon]